MSIQGKYAGISVPIYISHLIWHLTCMYIITEMLFSGSDDTLVCMEVLHRKLPLLLTLLKNSPHQSIYIILASLLEQESNIGKITSLVRI